MKHFLAGLAALLMLGTSVRAQPQIGTYNPPVVNPHPIISPFLNLNRGGAPPAVNYYGIVRPQIENQQAIQQLQQQFQTTQGQTQGQGGQLPNDQMAPTGRAAGAGGYFNYSHYFPLYTRAGGGANGVRR